MYIPLSTFLKGLNNIEKRTDKERNAIMCGGVYYIHNDEPQRVYFPNPVARLPVQLKGTMTAAGHVEGATALLPWGRRQKQPGVLPLGG
jgi:hypothetical protein